MNNILLLIFSILIKTVNTFPEIITQTHNQTLNISSTAILTCHVRDLDEHHVTWFKIDPLTSLSTPLAVGKQLFTTDKRYTISFYSITTKDSYWSLEIYQLNLSDEGTYICKIANRKASVSISINLYIQIPMIIHPTYVYIEPGTSMKLNCTILINDNPSNISWHFLSNKSNRTKFHDLYIKKERLGNISSSYLIINHAQISHTGIWTCVYRHQKVKTKVIVQKGISKYQRTSALVSNQSNHQAISRSFFSCFSFFLLLFFVYNF